MGAFTTVKRKAYNAVTALCSSVLSPFSPGRAGRYRDSRNFYHRTYIAGEATGPDAGFRPRNRSGDSEKRRAEKWLNARTRDQLQNNPLISGAVEVICYNVVRHGIFPEFELKGPDGELLKDVNTRLGFLFGRWQRRVDSSGHDWLCDIQRIILRHLWMDGEILIHRVWDRSIKGVVPLRLELLEVDHLDKRVDGPQANGNVARRGIELDPATGKPAAYHIFDEHPGDYLSGLAQDSRRIDAADIIHVYDRRRASQFSGISWMHAVVMEAYRMDEYRTSEQNAARAASAFVAFVHNAFPSSFAGGGLPVGGSAAPVSASSEGSSSERPTDISPNQITYVPGGGVTLASHNRPGSNYEPFIKDSKRTQAAGLTMSYEASSRDFTDASYASARSGSLEERLSYENQQGILNRQANAGIDAWFIEAAWLAGLVDIPGYGADRHLYNEQVDQQEPGWTWVDPKNDAAAAETKLAQVLDTRTGICAKSGKSWSKVLVKSIEEEEQLQELYQLRAANAKLLKESEQEQT